jgi:beta-lysine 5,6-aminomutase beta subunit
MTVDLTAVKPYGDIMNDGFVQLSFTLPVPAGDEAKEAAKQLLLKMGLDEPLITFMKDLGLDFTFFVAYGRCRHAVDYTRIQAPKARVVKMQMDEVNRFVQEHIQRKVVVVGACIGTDAHTMGLDAIMDMKGYHGHYGLERYSEFVTFNMGSQVPPEALVARAIQEGADAVLVSQVVTEKHGHIPVLTRVVELLEAEGWRDRVVLICGGPRISHELAIELGYDAGFGPGTVASDVAAFIVQELARRNLNRPQEGR